MSYIIRTIFTGILYLLILNISASAQDTYVYDNAGRLKSVTYGTGGPVAAYTYDDASNRTEEKVTGVVATSYTATHSNGEPLNLHDLALSLGYLDDGPIDLEVTISVDINGDGGGPYYTQKNGKSAIETGTWLSTTYDVSLKIIINTGVDIRGGGGAGGSGGNYYDVTGENGGLGGHAIYMEEDLEIVNNGTITGGGGGGGGGNGYDGGSIEESETGGGGGGGYPNGSGGPADQDVDYLLTGNPGSGGTTSGGGNGGTPGGKRGGHAASNGLSSSNGNGGAKGWGIKKNGNLVILTGSGTNSGTS